jgi:hypothetical protein
MTDDMLQRRLDAFVGKPSTKKQEADPRFSEKHVHKTPSGGDYSIAYYYDADRNPCEKARAKFVNIVEYTNEGNRINETYGQLGE